MAEKTKRKKGKLRWFITAAVILIVCLVILIILRKPSQNNNTYSYQKNTVPLTKMDLTESISATGKLESIKSENVSANVMNIEVQDVLVSVGDYVSKGDKLVVFDESDLEEAVKEAEDNYDSAKASADREVSNAKTQLTNAKENYTADKSKAEKEVSNAKDNLATAKESIAQIKKQIKAAENSEEKNALQQQLTEANEKKQQMQSAYDSAVDNLSSIKRQSQSSIDSANNQLESAKDNRTKTLKEASKQVDDAKNNLDACAVTAAIDGLITSVGVAKGDTYSGGTLVTIEDTSNYMVTTSIDEYDISNVAVDQRVVILTEATGDDELEGKISFVAPSTTATAGAGGGLSGDSMESGSSSDGYEVQIILEATDDRLRLGMTARCSIIINETDDVYAVPYDAVNNIKGDKYITVMNQDTGEENRISVTTGMETDYYIEVQSEELTEGMMIVIPSDEIDTSVESKDSAAMPGFSGMGGMSPMGEKANRGNGSNRGGGGNPSGPGAPVN